jgi:hypothetical protein
MPRLRWKLVLPLIGLIFFAGVTYSSIRTNHQVSTASHRYFWWSWIRLDSDPLNRNLRAAEPCGKNALENCAAWDLNSVWVDPGWLVMAFAVSALPAFVVGMIIVHVLRLLGISEIFSFMIAMPLLIFAWYYFIGWMIDHRMNKRPRGSPMTAKSW